MILIGRGLDFMSRKVGRLTGRMRSIERKKQEEGQTLRESFDVQLSGCAKRRAGGKARKPGSAGKQARAGRSEKRRAEGGCEPGQGSESGSAGAGKAKAREA